MVKNASPDQTKNADSLKRRPIHKESQSLGKNQSKKHSDESNSPTGRLYPDLVDEDEMNTEKEDDECSEDVKQCTTSNSSFEGYFLSSMKNVLLLLFLLIGVMCFLFPFHTQESMKYVTLPEKLKYMQNLFKDQNRLTFRILEKALEKVVNVAKEPSAPAIFTVIVNKDAIYKSHTFSRRLANVLAPQNTILINESVSWHNNPDSIKLKIDQDVQSKANKTDLFVVIVDNLHNIPLQGAMMFHSFCDHEAAPFKKGVFIFIVPINEILPGDTTSKKIDSAAFQQLKNIWRNSSPDEIDSLITRITVNVINII